MCDVHTRCVIGTDSRATRRHTHLVAERPAEVRARGFQPHAEQLQRTQARPATNRHRAWVGDGGRRKAGRSGGRPHALPYTVFARQVERLRRASAWTCVRSRSWGWCAVTTADSTRAPRGPTLRGSDQTRVKGGVHQCVDVPERSTTPSTTAQTDAFRWLTHPLRIWRSRSGT